jgi:hypothetical protein
MFTAVVVGTTIRVTSTAQNMKLMPLSTDLDHPTETDRDNHRVITNMANVSGTTKHAHLLGQCFPK